MSNSNKVPWFYIYSQVRLVMETFDEARYKVEPKPYGDFVATPAGVRASLDDPERKENPAGLSVTTSTSD